MSTFDGFDFRIFFFIVAGIHLADFVNHGTVTDVLFLVFHRSFVGVRDEKSFVLIRSSGFDYFQTNVVVKSGDKEL